MKRMQWIDVDTPQFKMRDVWPRLRIDQRERVVELVMMWGGCRRGFFSHERDLVARAVRRVLRDNP